MKSSLPNLARGGAVLAVAALVLASTGPAEADARDRLFATGQLAGVPAGSVLAFSRDRAVPANGGLEPIEGALTIEIAAEGSAPTEARVRFNQAEREVVMPPSPTTAAHPALLVFLETTVDSLSELTGGSPFYIKNRFIEAFAEPNSVETIELDFAGEIVAAERLLFRPFLGDPNADGLGPLAGLELAFVLSEAVPGELYSASATGGNYKHVLILESTEEGR